MKKCSYCGRDNTDETEHCFECGTDFESVGEPPSEPPPREIERPEYEVAPLSAADRQKDFVTLVTCRNMVTADIVASRLRAAGITAFFPDESLMQLVGWNFNTYGYVRVQISPKDYDAAKDLLNSTDLSAS